MAPGADASRITMAIEEQIRAAYLTNGWRVFIPEQFEGLAPRDEAVEALLRLVAADKLEPHVVARCSEGHDTEIPLASLRPGAWIPPCRACDDDSDDEEPRVTVSFEITSDWATSLAASEKKSPNAEMW